jgi:hypothetical protein
MVFNGQQTSVFIYSILLLGEALSLASHVALLLRLLGSMLSITDGVS